MTRALEFIELETRPWVDEASPPAADVVWRWTRATEAAPKDIEAIPSIASIAFTPATISLGESLGQRASLAVTLRDHRHIFNGEPFTQGTFFGKWRARYGLRVRGEPLRWIRGFVGQALDEMETRHFIVESVSGPTPDGVYTIVANDVLRLADDDRALAPRPSRGSLVAAIDADDTAATLTPTGIGDIDYPASGFVNIGGKEICAFTRSGDALTLTRATTIPGTTYETEVVAHDAGARVQLCLPFIAQSAAAIIETLFVDYAGMPQAYIDSAAWDDEMAAFLPTLYTAIIPEPTGVNKLVSELVPQAGLALWWEPLDQLVRLQVLRAIPVTAAAFTADHILQGSIRVDEQPTKRLSEVLVYYGQRNPLRPVDDADNYRAALLTPDLEAEVEYNGLANRTIMSRWIPFGAQTVASRMSFILLGRYRDPPRRIHFDTWRIAQNVPELGEGYQLGWLENQNQEGNPALAPIQVTRLNPGPEKYGVEAEEMLWTFYDDIGSLQDRVIIIPANINNVNLQELHDSIYPPITLDDVSASPPVTVRCIINAGVIVGSTDIEVPAFDVGDWAAGFVPTIEWNGRIQGKGGDAAMVSSGGFQQAQPGGVAFYTRNDVDIEYGPGAEAWGGAGGGGPNLFGGLGGGGGAGQLPGAAGTSHPDAAGASGFSAAMPGTTELGGEGASLSPFAAGDGGDPGDAGQNSTQPGGAAGSAIDGVSFVNVVSGSADVRGPTVN